MQKVQHATRLLIVVLTLIVIATGVIENLLPASIRSSLLWWPRTLIHVSGFRQNWTMFAPNVTRDENFFLATLSYADGSTSNLPLPWRDHPVDWFPLHNVDALRKWSSDFRQASPDELRDMAKFIVRHAPSTASELNQVILTKLVTHIPNLSERWISFADHHRESQSIESASYNASELRDE